MSWLLLLTVLHASPSLEVVGCPDAWLDAKQIRARLSLETRSASATMRVRCIGGLEVELFLGTSRRMLTLTGESPTQRERTLALFFANWLEEAPPPKPKPAPPTPTPPPGKLTELDWPDPVVELEVVAPPQPPPPPPLVVAEKEPPAPTPEVRPADSAMPEAVKETVVPVELGLVPRVGLNRLFPSPTRNHLALGLLGVSSDRLEGFSFAPISLVDEEMTGMQLGLVTAGREVSGFQLGLLLTSGLTVRGVQLSVGLSITRQELNGLQAGLVNVAGPVTGVQLGVLNVGEDVTGVQFGFVNFARNVKGVQVGFINFSKSGVVPIGIFNVSEDAPLRLALSASDTSVLNVSLETGGARLYGILSLGWLVPAVFRAGGGLGLHLGPVRSTGFFGELELTSHAVADSSIPDFNVIPSVTLGAQVGYRFVPRFAVFLGPQLTLLTGNKTLPGTRGSVFAIPVGPEGWAIAPGGSIGIEL